jgi:hypothetical protein
VYHNLNSGSSHLVGYKPSCKWINATYPTGNHVYNLLTKWGEPGNPGKKYQERRRVWLLWTERCWCGGTDEARMQFCAS